MRTSQAQINQDVAVALTEVVGRLEALERWRKDVDDERRDDDRRRDARDDKRPESQRATWALVVAIGSAISVLTCSGLAIATQLGIAYFTHPH